MVLKVPFIVSQLMSSSLRFSQRSDSIYRKWEQRTPNKFSKYISNTCFNTGKWGSWLSCMGKMGWFHLPIRKPIL